MNAKILLVDDDRAVRTSIARVLESANYTVIQAANGIEAMEQVSGQWFDVVLLDLNMPQKNGWSTLKSLSLIAPCLPVILITARPNQLASAIGAGVTALMEKPLDFHILIETLADLLAKSPEARSSRAACEPREIRYFPAHGPAEVIRGPQNPQPLADANGNAPLSADGGGGTGRVFSC